MDNFEIIYKVLYFLEKAMDCDEPDMQEISAERFKISAKKYSLLLEMLVKRGYVDDVKIKRTLDGAIFCNIEDAKITLSGLEYLVNDPIMREMPKKFHKADWSAWA